MIINRIRAGVAAGLVSVLALTAAACSSSGSADDNEPIGGPANLTVFAPQSSDQKLATNLFTKKMAKKFNIKFTWQTTTFDSGPAAEKRQIALASGDYPDLFLLVPWVDQFKPAELLKLGQQGVALPLNDLIKQYAPHIQKALDTNPDFKAMATAPDGKIYGMPQWVDCYHCSYMSKLWLNSAWLKKLGLKQPKTTEQLRQVLTAFKTKDPNGNGKADEVPLSADVHDPLIPYLMNAFIYDPQGQSPSRDSTLVLNNGKVDIQADKDGWRQGLKYIRSLYADGLIDKGAFTQNGDALMQLGDNAHDVILGSATVMHPAMFVTVGQKDKRDTQYDAVPPVTGPSGVGYAAYTFPSVPGATFVLTDKASKNDQVAAIKMLDYVFTDQGQTEGYFGEKGKDWEDPGPGDKALDPKLKPLYKAITQPADAPARNSNWGALVQYNNTNEYRNAQVQPTDIYDPAGYERRLFEATKAYDGKEDKDAVFPYWAVWADPSEASELATLQTNIENYVNQNSLQFITGSKNIDTDWNAYVQGFQGVGLPRYLQILQQEYEKSHANR